MSATWSSVYWWNNSIPANEGEIPDRLRATITGLGYTLYDPFDSIPGRAYPTTIKVFVAPSQHGWTRITGPLEMSQIPSLVNRGVCLAVTLDGTKSDIRMFNNGEQTDLQTALLPHLHSGCTADDLAQALYGAYESGEVNESLPEADIPVNMLPDDLQAMAGDLNQGQFRRMFKKMMGRFDWQIGSDPEAAREILAETVPQWESAGGRRIQAVMACLTVPDNWRDPDFITLRDAYQLHRRRQRNPQAHLYPGDAEALEAVPDALNYTPIYGGRSD